MRSRWRAANTTTATRRATDCRFVRALHLPVEFAVVVGGINRLIDLGRTAINVLGDMVGTESSPTRRRTGLRRCDYRSSKYEPLNTEVRACQWIE